MGPWTFQDPKIEVLVLEKTVPFFKPYKAILKGGISPKT
jgi:hypothetical protein